MKPKKCNCGGQAFLEVWLSIGHYRIKCEKCGNSTAKYDCISGAVIAWAEVRKFGERHKIVV